MLLLNHPSFLLFCKVWWLFQPLLRLSLSFSQWHFPLGNLILRSLVGGFRLTQSRGGKLVICWLISTYPTAFIFLIHSFDIYWLSSMCQGTVVAFNDNRNNNLRSTEISETLKGQVLTARPILSLRHQRHCCGLFGKEAADFLERAAGQVGRPWGLYFPWCCPPCSLIHKLNFSVPQSWWSS